MHRRSGNNTSYSILMVDNDEQAVNVVHDAVHGFASLQWAKDQQRALVISVTFSPHIILVSMDCSTIDVDLICKKMAVYSEMSSSGFDGNGIELFTSL